MIIWTRWGILVVVALALGAVAGSSTLSALGVSEGRGASFATMFGFGSLICLMLTLWVFPRLDRPQAATIERPLEQPLVDERGRKRTSEIVPVFDPDGNQVYITPRSTLFFIPTRFYWIIFAIVAIVGAIEWIFRS